MLTERQIAMGFADHDFIARVVERERQEAHLHLSRLLLDWRKELWPNQSEDPLIWEERGGRVDEILWKVHPVHAFFAVEYGAVGLIG